LAIPGKEHKEQTFAAITPSEVGGFLKRDRHKEIDHDDSSQATAL
jgi:hypothetical protein